MFDKFGEFNSVEELNMAAEGFLKEGDIQSLKEMGKENGLDEEDIEDYINGDIEQLATIQMAVFGRLKIMKDHVEKEKDQNAKMALSVIYTMLEATVSSTEMQQCIMKKEKRLEDIYNGLREGASKHKTGNTGVSAGTDRQLTKIIEIYYKQGKKEMMKEIEQLYK